MMKFSRATIGSSAKDIAPVIALLMIEYAKNATLISASHLILIGITKNSLMTKSGNSTAKAKNIDKLRKSGERYTKGVKTYRITNPYIILRTIPET